MNDLDSLLEEDLEIEQLKLSKLRRNIVKVKLPKLKKLTWNPKKEKTNNGLSPEQKEFVKSNDRNVLLVSTAGSGKTRSLTSRVIDLINHKNEDPERILLITFTVKAGEEMRSRVKDKLGDGIAKFITCGTFHSFAVRMLRKFTPRGIPKNFSILDASDAQETWVKCAEITKCMIGHTKALYSRYSVMRNRMISMEDTVDEKWPNLSNSQRRAILNSFEKNIIAYSKYKKRYAMYDFDDLLELTEAFLREDEKFRKKVASLYDFILVDEIQDCNAQQLNMLKHIVLGNKEIRKQDKSFKKISIYGVGDPSQSVYHFRGADHHLMESFPETFHAKVSSLVTNYRSTSQILNLANAIGDNFTSVRWKNKMVGTYNGEKPYYVRIQDENVQTEFVVSYIENWIKEKKVPGREIAVLYRSNSSATPLELALTQKGIFFEKRGGQTLLERAQIKDILALFKAAFYASDVIAWTRLLLLQKGIGAKKAQYLYTSALRSDNPIEYMMSQKEKDISKLGKTLHKLTKYNKNINQAFTIALDYIEPILSTKYGDTWESRKRYIKALLYIVSKMSSIKKMLTELALNPNGQNPEKETLEVRKQGGRVILSTVHSFKGLEVNNVFIINCNKGKFPSNWFMYDGKIPTNPDKYPPSPEKLDEERRLFYVACTRARHNLIILSPMSGEEYNDFLSFDVVKAEHSTESQFIQEIDIDSLANVLMPIKDSDTTNDKRLKTLYKDFE